MTTPLPNNETPLTDLQFDESEPCLVHAEQGKEILRRDISSHQSLNRDEMIRFVVSPDGEVVPDLAEKLPGRGLWVKADRDSLELVIKKGQFSRAAKSKVKADMGLIDLVQKLLHERCLAHLGLARRDGALVSGFEKVAASIRAQNIDWLIEAQNSADDGRGKLLALANAQQKAIKIAGCFNNDELSLALGLENAIHIAMISGRRCEPWSKAIKKLAGFVPIVPLSWTNTSPSRS